MNDIQQLLLRQNRWQKSRRTLPWPEKIRMAQMVRDSIVKLRSARRKESAGGKDSSLAGDVPVIQ